MNQQIIRSEKLGEQYIRVNHPSGLTILLCPMEGYSTSYALFATKYGSIDTCFKTDKDDEFFQIPEGTAHYLEHKMFESEEGDAFEKYATTGASANAFTSFDKTAFLFACSDQFKESLEILLDSVTHPYFTPETVAKEQGIIGQEIGMYDDSADWRVLFNALDSMYVNHPVKIDIAGTVESISHITDKTLYRCYNTFYNLSNMVLAVAGNFSVDEVMEVADKVLKKCEDIQVTRKKAEEPEHIVRSYAEQNLPVATPMFTIGIKSRNEGNRKNFEQMIVDEMIIDIICGETTPLYHRLYEEGLINDGINGEVMVGPDYLCSLIEGESKNPQRIYDEIWKEIDRLKEEGVDNVLFERTKKATYGRYISLYSKPDSVASVLVNTYFAEMTLYELLDQVAGITKEQIERRMRENLNQAHSVLSVVSAEPMNRKGE